MSATAADAPVVHSNDVALVGRLAAAAVSRELPSGDVLTSFRIVVERPEPSRQRQRASGRRSPTVDTLDCTVWRGDLRRIVGGWQPGDLVEVSGALRRRFWRAAAGAVSRCEVEVVKARRVRRGAT